MGMSALKSQHTIHIGIGLLGEISLLSSVLLSLITVVGLSNGNPRIREKRTGVGVSVSMTLQDVRLNVMWLQDARNAVTSMANRTTVWNVSLVVDSG